MDKYYFTRNSDPMFWKFKTALIWWKVCSFNSFIWSLWFQYKDNISFLFLFSLLCHSVFFFEKSLLSLLLSLQTFLGFFNSKRFSLFLEIAHQETLFKEWLLRIKWGISFSKQQFKALWVFLMDRFQLSQGCWATAKRWFTFNY